MFVLALLEDTVRIKPHQFGEPLNRLMFLLFQMLMKRLNEQFANKIIPGLGLCIIIYDLIDVGVSYILPGDVSICCISTFIDEVIEAKVLTSNAEGLTLSVIFFDDIFIPAHRLPQPSIFEEEEQIWYWEYQPEDGQSAKLYMDPGKTVRFRVIENIFKDVDPNSSQDELKREKSYQIIGSMAETGLGCVLWWAPNDESANNEDDEDLIDEDMMDDEEEEQEIST
ncbi:hypothetical protein DINM_005968 [Dirofilaria immitis]|nr:hypothetical protein [Dirofilaria immitis]